MSPLQIYPNIKGQKIVFCLSLTLDLTKRDSALGEWSKQAIIKICWGHSTKELAIMIYKVSVL